MKSELNQPNPPAPRPTSHAERTANHPVRTPRSRFNALTLLTLSTLLAPSCGALKPLKGGRALTAQTPAGIQQSLAQGDNPSQPTRQEQETIKLRTYTVPAGSLLAPSIPPITPPVHYSNAPLFSVIEREETRAKTELGSAQHDNARELGAKLASLKGITWVGLALFVFGLASLVWPPLKAVIGSVTTSAAILLGGLALLILPTLIVGNELLILGIVGLSVVAWFLAHRHGELRGQVSAQDFNRNLTLTSSSSSTPGNASGEAGK